MANDRIIRALCCLTFAVALVVFGYVGVQLYGVYLDVYHANTWTPDKGWHYEKWRPCLFCNGSGAVPRKDGPYGQVECQHCEGLGKLRNP